jgi:acyl-CoA thioesterase
MQPERVFMRNDPDTVDLVDSITMLKTLDIHLKEIGERHAVMTVTVSEIHRNYLGGAHGGLIATLVDTVSFFPRPLLPSGRSCTTTNLNVTYLRPAALGDTLSARAELLHVGRRMAGVSITVLNQNGKLVAHGSATLMILPESVEAG